ncbi:MAG: hypothetical protein V3U84_02335 [Thiotrichaceae bacterium]
MADIVKDEFTDTNGTALTAHTPDTGTGWTEVANTSTASIFEINNNACRVDVAEDAVHIAASCEPDPSDAEYIVECSISAISGSSDDGLGLFARRTDNDNFYALQILPNVNAENSTKIFKQVSSSDTELASFDLNDNTAGNYRLIITDAKKSVTHGGIEILSTTDNVLTSTGDAGIWAGNYVGDSTDITTFDNWNNMRTLDIPQEVVGTSDVSLGNWTDEAAGTTDIYTSIDEATADDSDYVQSAVNPVNDDYEFHIGDPTDPAVGTGHYIHYRARNFGYTTNSIRVRLLQGATEIFTVTHSLGVSQDLNWQYFRRELSTTEANNITDYTNLRFELRGV